MLAARTCRHLLLTSLLTLAALGVCACGPQDATAASGESAQAATASTKAKTAANAAASDSTPSDVDTYSGDPQLVSLSDADIQLYLTVMRAAAERVRHPSAQDRADLQQMAAFEAGASATGSPVAYDPVVGQRALLLGGGQTDQLIVAERRINANRYGRVSAAIEEIVIPPQLDARASCGAHCDNDAPQPSAAQQRQNALHDASMARNNKTVQPYREEIHALQSVVRNSRMGKADANP